ncbi:MAG: hypothetical protein WDN48_05995 [Pseudolabrys sp.]
MKRVLVVAHPDDEALWFGGLLISEPGDWTVICCSIPRTDPDRAWKFFAACELLGAKAKLLPFTEAPANSDIEHLDLLELSSFDEIVTHSAAGEYGHRHHIGIHRHIAAHWPEKMVAGCYGKVSGAKVVALTAAQGERKIAALSCYSHVSPSDGQPKWQALLDRYGSKFDLGVETYERYCA